MYNNIVLFFCAALQKLRPRNDQKENEVIISVLRYMYEEKQKDHVHVGEAKPVCGLMLKKISYFDFLSFSLLKNSFPSLALSKF